MIIIPLANMARKFVTYSNEEIAATYNWEMYIFLLCIFVSLTNQVRFGVQYIITFSSMSRKFAAALN